MKYLIIAKLVLLTLALVFVLWTMKVINEKSIQGVFAALGIEAGEGAPTLQAGTQSAHAADADSRLNLCKTRVHAIAWADGRKIEESIKGLKMKWMAHDPKPREISYLDMEKWLSQHCQIAVSTPSEQDKTRNAFASLLTIRFIDGTELEVVRAGELDGAGPLFRIGDQLVRSQDFATALEELRKIAQF